MVSKFWIPPIQGTIVILVVEVCAYAWYVLSSLEINVIEHDTLEFAFRNVLKTIGDDD